MICNESVPDLDMRKKVNMRVKNSGGVPGFRNAGGY